MNLPRRRKQPLISPGFTLVEVLVAVAVLAILLVVVAQMIGDTGRAWKNTSSKIDSLRDARLAFEMMTDLLRQATTNTYWDYFNSSGQNAALYNAQTPAPTAPFVPAAYGRQSELHFISGASNLGLTVPDGTQITQGVFFQCPGGYSATSTYTTLNSLLNSTGFFIEHCPDILSSNTAYVSNGPPTSVLTSYQPTYRFRLMQFIQPTENFAVYNYALNANTPPNAWFTGFLNTAPLHATNVRVVANNVIALILWPKKIDTATDVDPAVTGDTALAPNYSYDSRLGLSSGTAVPSGTWTPGTTNQPLQMNQMPPILRIAMVAIDEPSAIRLQGTLTTPPTSITAALTATNPTDVPPATLFSSATNMDSDLAYLQTELAAIKPKLNFRVFETTISIRSAKFSNP